MNRPACCFISPALAVTLALGIAACSDRNAPPPGKSPPSAGAPSSSGQAGNSGGTVMATPAAPDSQAGGSTGFKGAAPLPDTSGGPSSGPRPVGAGPNSSVSGPVNAEFAPMRGTRDGTSTNGGLPASALGSAAGPGGSTNSTPNSSTGNAAR